MTLLTARGITKRFSGTLALDQVSLDVDAGERVGLIGPNGAGKTTMFNCMLGLLTPDDGTVGFAGTDITSLPPYRRARLGIGRTFQRIEVFGGMTVREHFLVAGRVRRGGSLWRDLINRGGQSAPEQEASETMAERLGLTDVLERPVESLSLGRCRLVEVGRALMTEPRLLLLDEPSSGLDRHETAELAEQLLAVQRDSGSLAILLVEHDVEMIRTFVERLYVLDAGASLLDGPTADVLASEAVRYAYLGSAG